MIPSPKASTRAGAQPALVLAEGCLDANVGKTTHGLVRGSDRYRVVAVVDSTQVGRDAGEVIDGRPRGIPVVATVEEGLALEPRAEACIVGVAVPGGALPPPLKAGLVAAAKAGLTLVNGLHQPLAADPELAALVERHGGSILDVRKPRPTAELRFWTGEVLTCSTPRVAVLGTDCAVGKRTTAWLLRQGCRAAGLRAEMVYTGQTGFLLGVPHGFIFDATPNDFVSGELEGAVLACARELDPDVILIEGQSALRNPSGPCGAELLLSAAAHGAILQHAPARRWFKGMEERCEIPPLASEVELIRRYGVEVWAVTLNERHLAPEDAEAARERIERELGLPVFRPLAGVDGLVDVVRRRLAALIAERQLG